MTIVIAHGQPKSGSTFLYSTVIELSNFVNGENFHSMKTRVLGPNEPSFVPKVTPEYLDRLNKKIPKNMLYVVKTHGELSDGIIKMLSAHKVRAFTSFRDPRDTALSSLDAGARERRESKNRWFSKFENIDHLKENISGAWNRVAPWIRNPDVLAVPYYITALEQNLAVSLLTRHLGFSGYRYSVARTMERTREEIPEYNKGLIDRFIDGFEADELRFANNEWRSQINEYLAYLDAIMVQLGRRMAHAYYSGMREQRLKLKLQSS